MKTILILTVSIFLSTAEAKEYSCGKENNDPQIFVSLTQGQGKFQYIIADVVQLDLAIPDNNMFAGNSWETDRKYISFNPGWGESTVNIYARISEKQGESLFDIYATGMVAPSGGIIQTLSKYTCKEI